MSHPVFLVVDDDALLRLLLRRVIAARYPYAPVCFAASVAEARQLLSASVPTIVLTDYYLVGGTGVDVLAAARKHVPFAPVVVLSGDVSIEDTVLAAGAGAFIAKPFNVTNVEVVLAQLVADASM